MATLNVENVVYEARKPTVKKILISVGQAGCDEKRPTNKPSTNVPLMFAMKVPREDDPRYVKATWLTACLATAPSPPPRPINKIFNTTPPSCELIRRSIFAITNLEARLRDSISEGSRKNVA